MILKNPSLLAFLFLAACASVGPDYQRPTVEVPEGYKEMQGWKPAAPRDAAPRGSWWSMFDDAELDRLIARVEISNQTVRAAEARYRQAQALADQARAGLYPTVSANVLGTRSRTGDQPGGSVTANNFNAALNASWELDLWGRVRRSVEAGEAGRQASAADLESARLSAQATLAQNYFALRVADATRRLLEDTVVAYTRSLELTQNRYAAGVAARVDVVQAEVQLKTAQAQLIEVGVNRAQLEHAIALLVGEPPAKLAIAAGELPGGMPAIPVELPSTLLERRPDIASAERNAAAANARIGVAQAAYFPTVTLSGAAGYRSAAFSDLFTTPGRFWSLGAALAQTLFDGGLRKAQSAQAIAAYDEQVANYRQSVLIGFQEVEDNLAALRILEEETRLQQEVVAGARHALELTLNQYRAGIVSYLNVITAQTTLFNSESALANLQGRRLAASVGLVKALGGGWSSEALAAR